MKHDPARGRELPDTIECNCGQVVYRYSDGTKTNMDGSEHEHSNVKPKRTVFSDVVFALE